MGREPLRARWSAAALGRLRDATDRRGEGFLLEGRKAVLDALGRPEVAVREVWAAEDLAPSELDALERAAGARRAAFGLAPARDLARASGTVSPQGVLALAEDLGRPAAGVLRTGEGIALLLDRVQDPGNVGAILRVAAALGVRGALVGEGTADPLGPKALRASAGTAVLVPFSRGPLPLLLDAIAGAGCELWLLDGEGEPLWEVATRPAGLVLAVGSEGGGASAPTRQAARRRLAIPIAPAVESLNAGVAAGIALAHLTRLPVLASPPRATSPRARRSSR